MNRKTKYHMKDIPFWGWILIFTIGMIIIIKIVTILFFPNTIHFI
jgi:hypothetical protein